MLCILVIFPVYKLGSIKRKCSILKSYWYGQNSVVLRTSRAVLSLTVDIEHAVGHLEVAKSLPFHMLKFGASADTACCQLEKERFE